jgi:hypothetical protein
LKAFIQELPSGAKVANLIVTLLSAAKINWLERRKTDKKMPKILMGECPIIS